MTELRITGFAPADPQNPTLCLQVGGEVLTIPVDLDSPPPPPAPPAPDEHGTIEVSDTFDTDTRSECMQFAMQPEDDAVPHTTFGAGLVTATSDEDWFGAFQTSVSPTSPRISTVLEIDSFAPDGIGNVVYTGLVKDEENAVVGLYVTSARHAAFEVRVDGNIRLSNQVTDLDLQDGIQLGFSPDGPSASLWVDPARVRGGSCSPTPCCAACRTSPIPRSWRSGGTPSVCARSAARRSPRRRSRVVAGPEPATPFVTTSGHERVSVRI